MESRALEKEWAVAKLKDTAPTSPTLISTSASNSVAKNQFSLHQPGLLRLPHPAGRQVETLKMEPWIASSPVPLPWLSILWCKGAHPASQPCPTVLSPSKRLVAFTYSFNKLISVCFSSDLDAVTLCPLPQWTSALGPSLGVTYLKSDTIYLETTVSTLCLQQKASLVHCLIKTHMHTQL